MKNILLFVTFGILLPTCLLASAQVQEKTAYEIGTSQIKPKEVVEKNVKKVVTEDVQGETNDFRITKATEWNAYATIAIAILTLAIVILTFILAWETVRLRRIQAKQIDNLNKESIKPKIELYIDANKYSIQLLEVHVVNNGNGTANNVAFFFETDEDSTNTTAQQIVTKILEVNFFKIGLKHLGSGQNKRVFLMSVLENWVNWNNFIKTTIYATVSCEDDLGNQYNNKYTLNLAEFSGIKSAGGHPIKELADNIKKCCDTLSKAKS